MAYDTQEPQTSATHADPRDLLIIMLLCEITYLTDIINDGTDQLIAVLKAS